MPPAVSMNVAPSTFADLMMPFSTEEFLRNYWSRNYLHIAGPADRFSGLASWPQINALMSERILRADEVQLFRGGAAVASSHYLDSAPGPFYRLKAETMAEELANGATVLFHDIGERYHSISRFTSALATAIHSPVLSRLYVNVKPGGALNVHFEGQELFILAVEGRRHWRVYPKNAKEAYGNGGGEHPESGKAFDSALDQGSLLYVPQGWRCVAEPPEGPSLVLLLSARAVTGADLLQWFSEQLKEHREEYDVARKDLPILDSGKNKASYLDALHGCIQDAWSDSIVDQFLERRFFTPRVAPPFELPNLDRSATGQSKS